MATLDQHINARDDRDLIARIVAAAEITGIPSPTQWAQANVGRIVAVDVDGTTLADVHAYAVATYEATPRPGANPAAVTDAQILAAVTATNPATP